jgi:hypothetical protein
MRRVEKFSAGLCLVTALISAGAVLAAETNFSAGLAELVESEIVTVGQALEQQEAKMSAYGPAVGSGDKIEDGYYLRRFWLRVRPYADISIPGLAGFDVIPEVEMLWEKAPPQGWEIYRP